MAHQVNHCSKCGKVMHWPKDATVGSTYKCYRCNTVMTMVASGGDSRGVMRPGKKLPRKKKRKVNLKPNNSTPINNSCFPKGTMILTPRGTKEISQLNEGDYVISIGNDRRAYTNKILKVKSYTNKPLWSIMFNDGTSIKTTSSHSFLVENKWIKSLNIKQDDSISCYENGNIIIKKVISSFEITATNDVYNLYVENNFNFIADGVMAHSFSYFRLTRMTLWSMYSIMLNIFSYLNSKVQGSIIYLYPKKTITIQPSK